MADAEPMALRKAGRPPDAAKHAAIHEAARQLLYEHGYDFSLEEVARRAGVSRQTIYNLLPSKSALISAIIQQSLDALAAPLVADSEPVTHAETLTRFASLYLSMIEGRERIGMIRAMVSADAVARGDSAAFYEAGPKALRLRLTRYFDREMAAGRLSLANSELAADLFLSLISGGPQLRALLGVANPERLDNQADRVALAVRVFVTGLAASADAAGCAS